MIKLYTANEADEAEVLKDIAQVSKLYNVTRRRNRETGKMGVNISASIKRALKEAIAAKQAAEEQGK